MPHYCLRKEKKELFRACSDSFVELFIEPGVGHKRTLRALIVEDLPKKVKLFFSQKFTLINLR